MGCIIHAWGKDSKQCVCQRCGKIQHEYPEIKKDYWSKASRCRCSRCKQINPDPTGHTIDPTHPDKMRRCYCQNCSAVFHDWEGKCKCSKCGERQDENHDWDHCQCNLCGKSREEGHSWVDCKCTRCGMIDHTKHVWNGCVCKRCGEKRNNFHDWNGCLCKICGMHRDQDHQWDRCLCTVCGKTRKGNYHTIVDCRCIVCKNEFHSYESLGEVTRRDESWTDYKCRNCGKEMSSGYTGGM